MLGDVLDVSYCCARTACSTTTIAAIAKNCQSTLVKDWTEGKTYSPLPEGLAPKLLPTAPLQVQVFPALFFQEALAIAPTLRHVMAATVEDAIASTSANLRGTILLKSLDSSLTR